MTQAGGGLLSYVPASALPRQLVAVGLLISIIARLHVHIALRRRRHVPGTVLAPTCIGACSVTPTARTGSRRTCNSFLLQLPA